MVSRLFGIDPAASFILGRSKVDRSSIEIDPGALSEQKTFVETRDSIKGARQRLRSGIDSTVMVCGMDGSFPGKLW